MSYFKICSNCNISERCKTPCRKYWNEYSKVTKINKNRINKIYNKITDEKVFKSLELNHNLSKEEIFKIQELIKECEINHELEKRGISTNDRKSKSI